MKPNNHEPIKVPAIRGTMGDWIYYAALLKLKDVADRVGIAGEIHTSSSLNELLQRQLTERSEKISKYLQKQPQRFFNSLVVGSYGGNPHRFELEVNAEGSKVEPLPEYIEGTLGILQLDGTEVLWAIDGQHRVAGISEAIKAEPSLGKEEVSVIFVSGVTSTNRKEDPEGYERTRRLFTTLNRYAKPVSKKDIIALDEDDVVAIITRRLVEDYPLLNDRVSIKRARSLSSSDKKNFTTIIMIYDTANILLRGEKTNKAWKRFKTFRPEDEAIESYYAKAVENWDLIRENFNVIQRYQDNKSKEHAAKEYRHKEGGHLIFRPIGLKIIATAIENLSREKMTRKSAIQSVSQLPMLLSEPPWADLIWDTDNNRMLYTSENQKVAQRLMVYFASGDLSPYRKTVKEVLNEYAGIIKKDPSKIDLEEFRI